MSQEPKEKKCDKKDHLVKGKEDVKMQADRHHIEGVPERWREGNSEGAGGRAGSS